MSNKKHCGNLVYFNYILNFLSTYKFGKYNSRIKKSKLTKSFLKFNFFLESKRSKILILIASSYLPNKRVSSFNSNYFLSSARGGIWFSSIKKSSHNINNFILFNYNIFSFNLKSLVLSSNLFSTYTSLITTSLSSRLRHSSALSGLSNRSAVLKLNNKLISVFSSQGFNIYFNLQANFHLKALTRFFRASSFFIGVSETSAYTNYLDIILPVINENLLTVLLTCRLIIFSKYSALNNNYDNALSTYRASL